MFQYSEPVANCDQFAQFIISQLKPESIRKSFNVSFDLFIYSFSLNTI